MMPYVVKYPVNVVIGNGLMLDDTKPLLDRD